MTAPRPCSRRAKALEAGRFQAEISSFQVARRRRGTPGSHGRAAAPPVTHKLVPVFTSAELARLEHACAGRSLSPRRDAAIIAVFKATGIRLSELAGIRYDPGDPRYGDVDVWQREITVRGKGGRARIVKITYDSARTLDRYIRVRARHAQAHQLQLWLGVNDRGR